jgi:penicillin-binding protein 1A
VAPQYIRSITDASGREVYRTLPSTICDDCEKESAIAGDSEPEVERIKPELRKLEITSGTQDDDGIVDRSRIQIRKPAPGDNFAEQAISPQNAYLVRSMMMDVVRRGTGVRAMELGRSDLAGKTGTTNEQRDAWFSGYNDYLVTSVWVGFDNHEPLGRRELGGRAALPVWIEYMAVALAGLEDRPPLVPDGLAQARIDPETGLLAALDNPDAIMEIFQVGRLPPMQETNQGGDQDVPSEEDPYESY